MGGASIEQDGSLLVTTSLIPIGVPYLTKEGFQRVWIRVPNVDDPWSDAGTPAPGGGFTLLPAPLTSPLWSGRVLGGGEMVNVPLVFSAPAASAYLIRFVASAGAADIRVRAHAGGSGDPDTQYPGRRVQQHIQGWAPGPATYISTVNGPAQIWLQIVGYTI